MTTYAKAIAAGIFALLAVLSQVFGWTIPGFITEDSLTALLTALIPIVVYFVPNKPTEPTP
jgi:hypothetical protein